MGLSRRDKDAGQAVPEDTAAVLTDAPPSYSPREVPAEPVTPIHPPPRADGPDNNAPRIYTPRPPFTTNLSEIGAEPANVICPRCHYGVTTGVKASVGTHAG
jgi:hypothetical protein